MISWYGGFVLRQDIDDGDSDDDIPELEEQVGGDDSAEVGTVLHSYSAPLDCFQCRKYRGCTCLLAIILQRTRWSIRLEAGTNMLVNIVHLFGQLWTQAKGARLLQHIAGHRTHNT